MGPTGDQSTGLFFVKILRKTAANLRDRTAYICAPDHHRKIADVGGIFLFEVMMEKIFANPPGGKCRPSPMVLAFHHN